MCAVTQFSRSVLLGKDPPMFTPDMTLSNHVIEAFLNCKYKSYLKATGHTGSETSYEKFQKELRARFRRKTQAKLQGGCANSDIANVRVLTVSTLRTGEPILLDKSIYLDGLHCDFDALKRCSGKSHLGAFLYEPVLYCQRQKPTRIDRVLLAFQAFSVGRVQGTTPVRGQIICGETCRTVTVRLASYLKRVDAIISALHKQISSPEAPSGILNSHCDVCEFSELCVQKAIADDHLCLLRGISEAEIHRNNQKGIFTVNQLSYTFRFKKPRKRAKKPAKPRYFALQALSLREDKIHMHGTPTLPTADSQLYIDIEGIPETEFYYLIGVLVARNGQCTYRSFWADQEEDQAGMVSQFVSYLENYLGAPIFHYGKYDATAIRKLGAGMSAKTQEALTLILDNLTNVLSIVYHHIYFPSYSISLKDIGRFIGCEWTESDASGIQSVIWRKTWELNRDPRLKRKLINYNKEDCQALRRLCTFISHASSEEGVDTSGRESHPDVVHSTDLRRHTATGYVFRRQEFALEELQYVNDAAYFNYQREKVFVRTNRQLQAVTKRKAKERSRSRKVNKHVTIECMKCPMCGRKDIRKGHKLTRTCADLKFFQGGAKKTVLKYSSWRYKCARCNRTFVPPDWPGSRRGYGHGLASWCVYYNLACRQSLSQIGSALREIFDLSLPRPSLHELKRSIVSYYEPIYHEILRSIVKGPLIHIDETTVHVRGESGYVWVFTSMDRVYYLYRDSRKGEFLKEMLEGFSGVVVSDFYSAYDSLDCPQQKCLIHLIRDLNDDLLRHPFDDEFKLVAKRFSLLLRSIIDSIDRYGLKKRHLHKHKQPAEKFVDFVVSRDFSSEIARKYQKRFKKSGPKLFTFLDYDGVPWNNNNAEHAIKYFARYRTLTDGLFTEKSIQRALIMLSVFQTCEYNDTAILRFLLSNRNDLESILRSGRRGTRSSRNVQNTKLSNRSARYDGLQPTR